MAELRVSPVYLGCRLFPGLNAWITGARLDGEHIVFTIEGPDVPRDCDEVLAIVTVKSESVHLEPIGGSHAVEARIVPENHFAEYPD